MKRVKADKILFTHAHIIVDRNREYLDGALAISEGDIVTLFSQSETIYGDWKDYQIIDMHHNLLMPAFVDLWCLKERDLNEGVLYYGRLLKYEEEYSSDDRFYLGNCYNGPFVNKQRKGDLLDEDILSFDEDLTFKLAKNCKAMLIAPEKKGANRLTEILKENNVKVLWGKSDYINNNEELLYHEGYGDLYYNMTPYLNDRKGMINLAYSEKDKVKIVNLNKLNESVINDLLSLSNHSSIILYGDILSQIKILRKLNVNYRDIACMSHFNALDFYDYKSIGLLRGQEANLLGLDKDMNLLFVMKEGKIYL